MSGMYEKKISKKKIVLFAVIFLILVGFVWGSIYLKSVADYKQAVKETSFEEITLSGISDGVYIGEYDVHFIYAKVKVTVQNGEITNIDILEHRHERGKAADAISGATNSSTVIKKAVENALKDGEIIEHTETL